MLVATGFILIISTLCVDSTMIYSDRITDWGTWGSWDYCPHGSFVKAINLKIEPDQGRGDDSAVNAVRLSCVPIDYQVTSTSMHVTKELRSAEGPWGSFRGVEFCNRGVAVGFQLKSEGAQGKEDDTAANDMELICANSHGFYKTVAKGMGWGSWRGDKRCPPRTAVCGLRTQVEPKQGGGDDSALNNVDLICCDLPNPAAVCQPKDKWEKMAVRDNRKGTTPLKHKQIVRVGVQKTLSTSQSTTVTEEISLTVGFGMSATLYGTLKMNFETKLGISSSTQHSWSQTETSVFKVETEEMLEVDVPIGCEMTLFKIVGGCGSYVVNSNAIRREDKCSDGRRMLTWTNTTYIKM